MSPSSNLLPRNAYSHIKSDAGHSSPLLVPKTTSARGWRGNLPRMSTETGISATNLSAKKYNHTNIPSDLAICSIVRWCTSNCWAISRNANTKMSSFRNIAQIPCASWSVEICGSSRSYASGVSAKAKTASPSAPAGTS